MCDEMIDDDVTTTTSTFTEYKSGKLSNGCEHPYPVCESNMLDSVTSPNLWYTLSLPETLTKTRKLSSLQLESVMYTCQKHNEILPNGTRTGFLIGDGPGVGKGRILASIIYEYFILGKQKALWFSVSNDLKFDTERDFHDIEAIDIRIYSLNDFKYERIDSKINGDVKTGVIFATYHSLIAKTKNNDCTRLNQLLEWCGPNFDGCIVFDECHKGKNVHPGTAMAASITGLSILDLQQKLPNARVVYASATGASEPKDMGYMTRLGIWGSGTPFKEFKHFLAAVDERGVSGMEVLATEMKARGIYLARQLSFAGVTFEVQTVPVNKKYVELYDKCVILWLEAEKKFNEAAHLLKKDETEKKIILGHFWAAHQRFFKYICTSSKVEHVVKITEEALKNKKCVIIGLQATGEARTLEEINVALKEHVSAAKGVLQSLVQKQFPYQEEMGVQSSNQPVTTATTNPNHENIKNEESLQEYKKIKIEDTADERVRHHEEQVSTEQIWRKVSTMKSDLLDKINALGTFLPCNTLDELIDLLGGPEKVAEMTGRKGRVIRSEGGILYQLRSEAGEHQGQINLREKKKFMNGEKLIGIISDASSAGISLHADRRVNNQARRVHITLELPWSADKVIQQLGRSHRSNQVHPPVYIFVISDIAGEKRFISTIAKRLESLGALTHGDRRATETKDLHQFNIDNSYGKLALEITLLSVTRVHDPIVEPPTETFFGEVRLSLTEIGILKCENGQYLVVDKEYDINRFLNKILGLSVQVQNILFHYFSDVLDNIISKAKKIGWYDVGILDSGAGSNMIKRVEKYSFVTEVAKIELNTILIEKGLSYEGAINKLSTCKHENEGFYASNCLKDKKKIIILALSDSKNHTKSQLFCIYRPNIGLLARKQTLEELNSKYCKTAKEDIKELWIKNYEASLTFCSHIYIRGECKRKLQGKACEVGLRKRFYNVLTGGIFSAWNKIECICTKNDKTFKKLQVMSLKIDNEEKRIVGFLIPNHLVNILKNNL